MPLDLTKRSEVSAPLTATQYDATMTAIENFVNGLETSIASLQASQSVLTLSSITGTLAIAKGGTGQTTVSAARTALQVPYAGASGNDITALWRGTQSQYDAIVTKSASTLYIITT